MRKLLKRLGVIALVSASTSLVMAAPASAATGGGCTPGANTVSPCVSLTYPNLNGDFYMNATPDSSRAKYRFEFWVGRPNQPWRLKDAKTGAITRTGRYGAWSYNIAALPKVNEHAFTRIYIYTSSNAVHYQSDSPYVYYGT